MLLPLKQVLNYRMRRQHLAPETRGACKEDLLRIIRDIQPIHRSLFSLHARMDKYDPRWCRELIDKVRLFKGRFIGGNLYYVAIEDMPLYATAFRAVLNLRPFTRKVLGVIEREGPITKDDMGRLLEVGGRRVYRALTELERAFLIAEVQKEPLDQFKGSIRYPWNLFRREYPLVDLDAIGKDEAIQMVLLRFLYSFGPATITEIASWSEFKQSRVRSLVDSLVSEKRVLSSQIENMEETSFFAAGDKRAIEEAKDSSPFITILSSSDPIVTASKEDLRREFGYGRTISSNYLYIMMNGDFCGAIERHWKEKELWIKNLILESTILDDLDLFCQTLQKIESARASTHKSIKICRINWSSVSFFGRAQRWLKEHGYILKGDCFLKKVE